MVTISRSIFLKLHDAIIEKCKTINPQLSNFNRSGKFYGFGLESVEVSPSVISIILQDEAVSSFLESKKRSRDSISGKHLYRAYLECTRHDKRVLQFRGVYQKIYFLFLGCQNLKGFIELYISTSVKPNLLVKYKCYYYSFKNHEVRTFSLKIDYNQTPSKCVVKYLHDANDPTVYYGEVKEKNRLLFAHLLSDNTNELNIIGALGTSSAINMDIIFCTFQGISITGYPFCGEMIITRLDEHGKEIFTDTEKQNIYFYLMMQRRLHRIPSRIIRHPNEILAQRFALDELKHLVGTYRIWSFTKRMEVVQSKFIIEPDFKSYLDTSLAGNSNHERQICILRVSDINGMKLCISCHEQRGIRLLESMIIDFPRSTQDRFTRGVRCSIGVGRLTPNSHFPNANFIVLLRDKNDFEPKVLLESERRELIKKNPDCDVLYNNLSKFFKDNHIDIR